MCRKEYPVLYEQLVKASEMIMSNGRVPCGIKQLYGEIIEFTLQFYKSLSVREREESFTSRKYFLISLSFMKQIKDPAEKTKMPGIVCVLNCFLNTPSSRLACLLKIYGFKKMVQGESPRIIFDLITTRF